MLMRAVGQVDDFRLAAFSMIVSPSADRRHHRFSVPVTVTMSVQMRAPFKRVALAWT